MVGLDYVDEIAEMGRVPNVESNLEKMDEVPEEKKRALMEKACRNRITYGLSYAMKMAEMGAVPTTKSQIEEIEEYANVPERIKKNLMEKAYLQGTRLQLNWANKRAKEGETYLAKKAIEKAEEYAEKIGKKIPTEIKEDIIETAEARNNLGKIGNTVKSVKEGDISGLTKKLKSGLTNFFR